MNDELTPDSSFSLPEGRPILSLAEAALRMRDGPGIQHWVGAHGCAPALLARALVSLGAGHVAYVAADAESATRAAADLGCLGGLPLPGLPGPASPPPRPLLLLAGDSNPYAEVHPDRRAMMTRASTLFHMAVGLPWQFLVTTASALARRVVPANLLAGAGIRVEREGDFDVGTVAAQLVGSGYLRVPVVEDPGSFAVRGGIVDVWPPAEPRPLRIELYGDLVASLRHFEPDEQRTIAEVDQAWLSPAREAILTPATVARARTAVRAICDAVNFPSTRARQLVEDVADGKVFFGAEGFLPAFSELVSLYDTLPTDTVLVVDEGSLVLKALREELERAEAGEAARASLPHFPRSCLFLGAEELYQGLHSRATAVTHRGGVVGTAGARSLDELDCVGMDTASLAVQSQDELTAAIKATRSAAGREGALDPLVHRIQSWTDAGLEVVITARVATQANRLATLLTHRGVALQQTNGSAAGEEAEEEPTVQGLRPRPGHAAAVRLVTGTLARGAVAPASGFVLLTEEEIFGARAHRQPPVRRSPRAVLEDLRALSPGDFVVHVEHGVGKYVGLERRQIGQNILELLVVEYVGGRLFLPVYRLNQLQKHSGGEGAPRLDRLGGLSFAKTKARVQGRVREMADGLLRLYAERSALRKQPLPPMDDEYAAFEATFPYEETRDQAVAIQEVLEDLGREKVMDRLVCGDVGFGKTEVALRAAFRNVMAGRQVALLCPTTVLAQQHYLTFTRRLADYPIEVRALSRFQSKEAIKNTVQGLRKGSVDIVIGTHRLLSKDVHFNKLGLLIVDEEQRFGVVHKERIKQLRASVDALTLSATPIPRTLQMAIGGLRDLSLITTPPVDRRAIRTITSRNDDHILREAIERELQRGGQVFYVFNRVEGLHERAAHLQELFPSARIAVAHGQQDEALLEKTMLRFVAGEDDILVCTAIIESGIDIPRANTMIIDRADLFGLAQLYQLRGRVGRASERAYCYLLVPPPSKLTDDARSRIEALERYASLGSGFQIATLDLELRGAGEVLGAEQSGLTAAVGFDLFCQMLEDATRELQGGTVVQEVEPELSVDVEALLPESYVEEVGVRLSLYKRLASAVNEEEVGTIAAEMEDRFGSAPREAQALVDLMRIKTELRRLRVLAMEATTLRVSLHLRDDTPLDPRRVGELVGRNRSFYQLSPDGRLIRRAKPDERVADGLVLADRMLAELQGCWS